MLEQSKGTKAFGTHCPNSPESGACCIDTYRIYDSCRNQECLEDLKLLVTDEGQRILDSASAIRVKALKVLWTKIDTEEMPFNKGYFQINIRYWFHCVLDCCTGMGTGQDVAGLCVFDQSVLLFGGEGNVSVFKSDIRPDSFCPAEFPVIHQSTNHPRAVVEVAEPVALRLNVLPCGEAQNFGTCYCSLSQIPDGVAACFAGRFTEPSSQSKVCFLSMGLFSLVRIERPAQLVVPACDSCIPSKNGECELPYTDPCALFRSMEFPVSEFYPELRSASPCASQNEQKES